MRLLQFTTLIILVFFLSADLRAQDKQSVDYQQLTELFKEWRTFEKPPLREGAPDYTAVTFEKRWSEFLKLREKLNAIDHANWSTEKQVDWRIVWAEMNGYEFNYKTLKSWVRDPAFYKTIWTDRSDVPAHEGPTHHAVTELWTYKFPLSNAEMNRLIADLEVIQPLNEQAKINLTGNAKELWVAGIRDIRTQSEDLSSILTMSGVAQNTQLVTVINQAKKSTDDLVNWLEKEAKLKTGPSGIGKENYTWYQQNVHLVPLTWDEEVMLLKTELSRAWSLLKMEEHRNRNLPQLKAADSPEAYDELAKRSAESFIKFLDKRDIVTVKDYFAPALNEHLGRYIPKETRNFFYITMHYDPRPLYSHFYHWFELARMDNEPNVNPIRKGALLYNIFDSRNEGIATAVEELFMQAGLYDDSPRVREMVYILIAQRAARGLGSLYAHANELTMEEAGKIHSEYTPRGWMKTEKELLLFEQHLYLRQPGYGTSYITGKYLLENAMAEYAKKVEAAGEEFKVKDFFDRLNEIDNISMTLGHWELTGDKGHLGRVFK
jgi:hypothetical protein